MRWETTRPFLVSRKILGFLSIFKKSEACHLGSIELHEPLEVLSDVRPPVQVRLGNRVFSRVSTEDSDIPSSCEMKDEPAFKPLQGNPTLFLVRESRNPVYLRQQTQGPSHITIAEGRLLLRCLWRVGAAVQ